MSETEYAVMADGEIINVITTSLSREHANEVAEALGGTAVLLDSLPLEVKRRYQFWDERP